MWCADSSASNNSREYSKLYTPKTIVTKFPVYKSEANFRVYLHITLTYNPSCYYYDYFCNFDYSI